MGSLDAPGARSAAEAVTAFFETHQRVVSCVTTSILVGQLYRPTPHAQTMAFAEGVARLGRGARLLLAVRLGYRLVAPAASHDFWRIATENYAYRLRDREGRFILSYHWHPAGRSPIIHPHLHVGCRIPPFDLGKAHLPTGLVTLAAVIRMAIAELGVEPLRPDWPELLDRADRAQAG